MKPLDDNLLATKLSRLFQTRDDHQVPYGRVPASKKLAKCKFDLAITTIEERGVWFISNILPSKGTKLTISSPKVFEIFKASSVELRVFETKVEDDGKFSFYGEIDPENSALNDALRSWLLINGPEIKRTLL